MAQQTYSWGGIGARVVTALLLVLLTFNPSGWSYYHWIRPGFPHVSPGAVLAGIVLIGAWALYLSATVRSLGYFGIALLLAFFAALCWLAVSAALLNLARPGALDWVILVCLGLILGIGLSWSLVHQRLTGQVDVDETERRG